MWAILRSSLRIYLVYHFIIYIVFFFNDTAGLVVLRVAEVAQFQEKILRAILNGDIKDVVVTPQQM